MTDNITAPPADRVSDAQSPHLSVIRDNIPDWYTEAQGSRKAELASLDLRIPDWYKKASQADRDRLGKVHKRSRASLNQLDQMLGELKPPAEYAEPLLADAIEKKFGQRLDTRKVFYARRGPGFTEQVEVILAYRTLLADRLELPVKSREMLFPQQANVSQAAIDEAYAQVLRDERNTAAEETFLTGRLFWETHLRSRYPQELKALMTPELDLIDEKSTALFELSDLQGEQVGAADQATKDQWQAMHDQVTDRLAGLLGRRRDEILVNGAMQSAFFESELKQLGVARQALEQRSLRILTRRVLNNFAATQGTPL